MFKLDFKLDFLGNSSSNINLEYIYKDLTDLLPYAQKIYSSSKRYACVSGGRSSTKTNLAGAYHVVKKSFSPQLTGSFILCTRTFATKIETTTYTTVCRVIRTKKLEHHFRFVKSKKMIINKTNNVTFLFSGLQNPTDVKSTENISIWWHDEAEDLPRDTIEVVAETLRGNPDDLDQYNPKIVFTFNPMSPIDDVKDFCMRNSEECDFAHINIFDLPKSHQNPIMLKSAERDRKINKSYFEWKWLGLPHPRMANQPFANIQITDKAKFTRQIPTFAWLDPSFKGLDTTALTILQAGYDGKTLVTGFAWEESWYNASDKVAEKLEEYFVRDFYYEDNAIADAPFRHFRDTYGINSIGKTSYENKVRKIYAVGFFVENFKLLRTNDPDNLLYIEQIIKYNKRISTNPKPGEYDDAPDSLASLIGILR